MSPPNTFYVITKKLFDQIKNGLKFITFIPLPLV